VTFRLVRPRGDFLSILALQFAAPVPTGTPAEDQSTRGIPSTTRTPRSLPTGSATSRGASGDGSSSTPETTRTTSG
jgi:hypothetical protein